MRLSCRKIAKPKQDVIECGYMGRVGRRSGIPGRSQDGKEAAS